MPPRKPRLRQLPVIKWKKASDVKRLTFTLSPEGKPIRVGGEATGDYFLGRLRFADGKVHRVAIKRFKPIFSTNQLMVAHFNAAIKKLARAGVRMPKAGIMKIATPEHLEGEWVMVTPFFGSRKHGSAFEPAHVTDESPLNIRLMAMEQITRIANAGLLAPVDAINVHTHHERGVRVIDFDFTIEHILYGNDSKPAELFPKDSAKEIELSIDELSFTPLDGKLFWAVALKFATPKIRAEIKRIIGKK